MLKRLQTARSLLPLLLAVLLAFSVSVGAAEQPEDKIKWSEELQTPSKSERYLDKPVDPETYIVGPGDRFLISFYGAAYEPVEIEILPEGIVAIPEVGAVKLGQVTLTEAKRLIAEKIATRYRGSEIGISLSQLRLFKVNVTGAVEKPGAVVVSASDRVAEAIDKAGGLQLGASRRNISLRESGGHERIADLTYFFATGELTANPYLHEGQVIFVPMVSDSLNTVEIYGAVNQPDTFEYHAGDRVLDLLKLGFGPRTDADLAHCELVRFMAHDVDTSLIVDLTRILADPADAANVELMPDDRLFVRAIAGFHVKEQASVRGEVRFPGDYPLEDGCRTVGDLIKRAGGILPEASLSEAQMTRVPKPAAASEANSFDQLLRLSTEQLTEFELQYLKTSSANQGDKVAVDFRRLVEEGRAEFDVPLQNGDVVIIPPKSYTVTVLGRVVSPGQVPFRTNQNVEYYISLTGGYGYKANKKEIRIIKVNTGSVVKPSKHVPIEMGDRIMVPEKTGTDWWGLIKDAGLFLANVATIYVVVDQAVN